MVVLVVTCKNEDLITNEGDRLATRLYVDFSDAHGQITSGGSDILKRLSLRSHARLLQDNHVVAIQIRKTETERR